MGYRGKVVERERARGLREQAWTLLEIAEELGVSKSSVSVWVRDVDFSPRPQRRPATKRGPNVLERRKAEEIERGLQEGREWITTLSERDLLIAGTALYAGEGGKTSDRVSLANSDPRFIALFCTWLRRFFNPEEHRLRATLYLHEGLDLEASTEFWSQLTGIPGEQFGKPYRAVPDAGIRNNKHEHGCLTVRYHCARTHRRVMGLVHGLLGTAAALASPEGLRGS